MMEQLRDDFREERENARQSRAVLHERMDAMAEDVGTIKGDIRILGEVDGQVRRELKTLSATVTANQDTIQPTIDDWKRIRGVGLGIVGLLAIGGISLGAAAAWAGEGLINAIRGWLRIS